jgi:lipoprotein-anchoring transpeptidase ErfK/SrfK
VIGILAGVLGVAAFSAVAPEQGTTVAALAPTETTIPEDQPAVDDVGVEPDADTAPTTALIQPVTTTTIDSTALPANSGKGRRIVYANKAQRVWAVNEDGSVARTYRVSGRKWVPEPGTYHVFGKSEHTRNKFFPEIEMDNMVRFAISPNGKNTIGFHEIPTKNGVPMQTVDELGTHRSGGCIRQSPQDATWLYRWSDMGTKVVVLA